MSKIKHFYSPRDVILMLKEFQKLHLKATVKTLQILETFYKDYQQQVKLSAWEVVTGPYVIPLAFLILILEYFVGFWLPFRLF